MHGNGNILNSTNDQKCLLVFDLNGTLLKRVKKLNKHQIKVHLDKHSQNIYGFEDSVVYIRPHLNNLAQFLHHNHIDHAIWTSTRRRDAKNLYDLVQQYGFKNEKFYWTRKKCSKIANYNLKSLLKAKDLHQVWNEYQEYNPNNVILVDDSLFKATCNEHLINLKTFKIDEHETDNELELLIQYLKKMFEWKQNTGKTCFEFMQQQKF